MADRIIDHSQGQDACLFPSSPLTAKSTEYHSAMAPLNGAADTPTSNTGPISSRSSEYHSTRIDGMIASRSQFSTELEFEIENSKVHWSHLTKSSTSDTEETTENDSGIAEVHRSKNTPEGYQEYFEKLKKHPQWGPFFSEVQEVVVGEKIAEGAQAEIYEAEITFKDGKKFKNSRQYGIRYDQYSNSEFVVKVMKGNCALQDLQRQWPSGMLQAQSNGQRLSGPLKFLSGGTLLKDAKLNNRFAFVMDRLWGDLRKLIDLRMRHNNNQGPPFHINQVKWMAKDIARDLRTLHGHHGIIHKDIKAANVLIFRDKIDVVSYGGRFRALLVDWECSVGVVGTSFWRAPEVLQQLKNKVRTSKLSVTKKSDLYSYGMLCYEMVTGCIPFEGHPVSDYDVVLDGYRPKLPEDLDPNVRDIIHSCWHEDPSKRPYFEEILGKFHTPSYLGH